MEPYKKITLENGLRVILVPQPQSVTTTALVLVEVGSKYETKELNGLSHFLEHMCFKGTEKRPKPIDIAIELDQIGGASNAFTTFEYTGYYIKTAAHHFLQALELVSDIYLHPTLPAHEIDKERGVIHEEINMYEDQPMQKAPEVFDALLYGDQPAGWPILGPKENISRFTREDFLSYRAAHYLAESTVLVISGAFDEVRILDDVRHLFSLVPSGGKEGKLAVVERQEHPVARVFTKATDQSHLVMGVRAFGALDPRRYALEVLSDVLGGGMSSRLFQRVREEMGAAYYLFGHASLLSDHGVFQVRAGVPLAKIDGVITAICEEFVRVTRELVLPAELQRVKDHLTGGMMLHLETSEDLAGFYGGQEITEKILRSPHDIIASLQAVTADEVIAVARDIIQPSRLNLAVVGPFHDAARFEKLLKL